MNQSLMNYVRAIIRENENGCILNHEPSLTNFDNTGYNRFMTQKLSNF